MRSRRAPAWRTPIAIVVAAAALVMPTSAADAAPVRTLSRVSLTSAGAQATGGASTYPSISADGQLVAFASDATNLVPGDTNGATDVFVRNRSSGITERVSVRTNGTEATGASTRPVISADGSAVVFTSTAPNLVTGDTNGQPDVFVHDLGADATTRVSVTSAGAEGSHATGSTFGALSPSISDDGSLVAFDTVYALVASDGNGTLDTYVHNRQTGATTAASLDENGDIVNAALGGSFGSAMSGNGRFVAWYSGAPYVANDTNDSLDLYVRDRQAGTTERVSLQSGGGEADTAVLNQTLPSPALSSDGRYFAFWLQATDLVPGDNFRDQIYVHDRITGETERVSEPTGTATPSDANSGPTAVAIAAGGRYVVFPSAATNLVTGDTNVASDVFVHDRAADETVRVNITPNQAQSTGGGSNHLGVTQNAAQVVFESPAADLVTGDTNAVSDVFVATANTAPTATGQSVTTPEDTALAIALTGTDPEDDPLTFTHGSAAHGTITGTGADLLYTPASDYNGPDSFTFTVTDPGGLGDSGLMSITVTAAPMIATSLVADPAVVSLSGTPKLRLGTVSAQLVRTDTGEALAGRTIAFSVGAQPLCTATTDATGRAVCTLPQPATRQVLVAGGYDAAFAGDADFSPSSAHAGLVH